MPNVRMLKPYSHRISPLSVREWPGTGTFSMPDDIAAAAIAAGAGELVVEPTAPTPFTELQASVLASAADAIIAQATAPAEASPADAAPVAEMQKQEAVKVATERKRRAPRAQ